MGIKVKPPNTGTLIVLQLKKLSMLKPQIVYKPGVFTIIWLEISVFKVLTMPGPLHMIELGSKPVLANVTLILPVLDVQEIEVTIGL